MIRVGLRTGQVRPEEPELVLVGAGQGRRGWSVPVAYVTLKGQGSSEYPVELDYRKNSRNYRLKALFYRRYGIKRRLYGYYIDKTAELVEEENIPVQQPFVLLQFQLQPTSLHWFLTAENQSSLL